MNILKLKNLTSFNQNCTIDTNIIVYNNKQIINFINYYNYIKQVLKIKNIYLENINFYLNDKNLIIHLIIYYSALKLTFFKKKSKLLLINKSKNLNNINYKNTLFPINFIKNNKINTTTIKFLNINKEINAQKTLNLYKTIKTSIVSLLKKKRYLLVDFIRVTVLLLDAKITVKLFTNFIGQMFATLSKKNHNRFFLILKKLFTIMINDKKLNSNALKIQGIKLKISGRLRGKPRSDIKTITVGTVPLQSKSKHIEYFKQHVFTIYGTFGLKIWIFRAITN